MTAMIVVHDADASVDGRVAPSDGARRHDRRVRRRAPRHQAVLRLVRELADARGPRAALRHLRSSSRPRSCGPSPRRSCSPRSSRSSSCSTRPGCVDVVLRAARSTRRAARRPAEDFVARGARRARCGARLVVVGADFHFGHRRRRQRRAARADGRRARLRGARARPRARPTATRARVPYSSTRGPRAARRRATSRARPRLLGRPHEVRGTVERGDRRGRELGFPTANVAVPRRDLPAGRRHLRRHVRRRRRRRARRGDLARPPPDLLRGRRARRCSRRTSSTSTATSTASRSRSGSSSGSGARSASTAVDALVEQMRPRRRGDPPGLMRYRRRPVRRPDPGPVVR